MSHESKFESLGSPTKYRQGDVMERRSRRLRGPLLLGWGQAGTAVEPHREDC